MGRGRGRGKKRVYSRDFGTRGGREDVWDANKRAKSGGYEPVVQHNAAFEEYYKAQGICPEDQWEDFMATLRRPLPLTFRINGGGRFATALRTKLEADFFADFAAGPIFIDGETLNPPQALPWYPDNLGWQLEFSRTQLRKLPALEALHEFIKRETTVGAITRQEAVSMVPPLFLDVAPHHRVLDSCAAPGSKTAQLLEALHAGPAEPTGVVVANDADAQRCNMLSHQTQRIRSPAVLVTNHEAQNFPLLWDLDPASPDAKMQFDRVLCDVPCSGDGTLRKQPDIWRKWTAANGNGLHLLQLRIALRSCCLLKVGGRMVYSTCTFNPIEDEAVVAEVLRRTGGAMRLVDVSAELPALKRELGMRRWRVRENDTWYDSWEEGKSGRKLQPSMFPGPETEDFPLEHCMRFLPQAQNTGGFFVAVLEKVSALDDVVVPQPYEKPPPRGTEQPNAEAEVEAVGGEEEGAAAADGDAAAVEAEGVAVNVVEEAPAAVAAAAEPEAAAPEVAEKETVRGRPRKVLPEWGAVRGGGCRNTEPVEPAAAVEAPPTAAAAADNSEAAAGDAAVPAAAAAAAPIRENPNRRGRWRGIDPIVPFVNSAELATIRKAYGLGPECPIPDRLVARSLEERPKRLSYIGAGSKQLLLMDVREQLKVTTAGVKMFERQENREQLLACVYRVSQEGLPLLLPYITRQRFQPTAEELIKILTLRAVGLPETLKVHITAKTEGEGGAADEDAAKEGEAVNVEAAVAAAGEAAAAENGEGATAAATAAGGEAVAEAAEPSPQKKEVPRFFLADSSTLEQLSTSVVYGCCIATLRQEDVASLALAADGVEGGVAANAPICVTCWRGRGSLNVLVSKEECSQMAERLQAAIDARAAAAVAQPVEIAG